MIATRGGDHLDAGTSERDNRLDELGRGIAVVIAQHARAGGEHRGVQIGKDILDLGKTLAHLARKLGNGRQGVVGHGYSVYVEGFGLGRHVLIEGTRLWRQRTQGAAAIMVH